MRKGQMFLITAVIIITALIVLVTTSNLTSIVQEKRELEGRLEQEYFVNIVNEFVKVIDISYYQPNNITNNIFNFGNFTRKKMIERSLDSQFLYVSAVTPSENDTATMNVTIINLLNKPINATLQLNESTPVNFSDIADYDFWTTNFTITQGNNYILKVGYNGTYEENMTINTLVNQSRYFAFYDITLTSSGTNYKDKFQKSYNLGSTSLPSVVQTTTQTSNLNKN